MYCAFFLNLLNWIGKTTSKNLCAFQIFLIYYSIAIRTNCLEKKTTITPDIIFFYYYKALLYELKGKIIRFAIIFVGQVKMIHFFNEQNIYFKFIPGIRYSSCFFSILTVDEDLTFIWIDTH